MPGDCMICWAMFGERVPHWYDEKCYASSPSVAVDPPGPPRASDRVIRGGCWGVEPRFVRSANRNRNVPENRNNNLGPIENSEPFLIGKAEPLEVGE